MRQNQVFHTSIQGQFGRLLCSQVCKIMRHLGFRLQIGSLDDQSIGLMTFDAEGARAFREKLEEMMDKADALRLWYLSAIDQLAGEGLVGVCPVNGLSWCEVDDASDFAAAADVVDGWPARA